MIHARRSDCLVIIVAAFIAGCQAQPSGTNPERLAEARHRLLLTSEPAGVQGVLDVQESIKAPQSVVLVGQIGGVERPWSDGRAAFVMADPVVLADDDGHECSDSGCAFCAKKSAESLNEGIAYVRFVDAAGDVIPLDARELFGIAEQQTVVVRGHAEMNGLGCLVVSADGLYIRR